MQLFGLAIVSIITLVIRSSRAGTHRDSVRDSIEDAAVVEPGEVEECRVVNPELDSAKIREVIGLALPLRSLTYPAFLKLALTHLRSSDPNFYLAHGHVLDRCAFSLPGYADDREYPAEMWMLLLTNALHSSVEER